MSCWTSDLSTTPGRRISACDADGGEHRVGGQVVPRPRGSCPRATSCTPWERISSCRSARRRCKNGAASIWSTAGVTSPGSTEIDEAVRAEFVPPTAEAETVGVDVLDRSQEAVVVAEGPVDQVQVDVAEAEALEGSLKGGLRVRLARVLDPQLRRDEQPSREMPLLRTARRPPPRPQRTPPRRSAGTRPRGRWPRPVRCPPAQPDTPRNRGSASLRHCSV